MPKGISKKKITAERANAKFEKILLTEREEEYLDIYHKYFVLRWDWTEISTYHKCPRAKIQVAINWVIDNKLKFPSDSLVKGAIDAISVRLKFNRELYNAEVKKKRYRDNSFIISLTREIRDDEKLIYELESIHGSEIDDKNNLNAGQVLALLQEAKSTEK